MHGAYCPENRGPARECRHRPVPITVRAARCLTAPDAEKRTLAVQLELPSAGLYKPGDAIGLVCPNDDVTVDALLARLRLDGTKVGSRSSMVHVAISHIVVGTVAWAVVQWMSLALRPGPEAVAGTGFRCASK